MNFVPSCDIQIVRAVTDVFPLNYVFADGYKTIANMSQNPQHVINSWHNFATHGSFCLRFSMVFVLNSKYMLQRKWGEEELALLRFVYLYLYITQSDKIHHLYTLNWTKYCLHRSIIMFVMQNSDYFSSKIHWFSRCYDLLKKFDTTIYITAWCMWSLCVAKSHPFHHDINNEILLMRDKSFGWNSNMSPFKEGRQLKIWILNMLLS